MSFPVSHKTVVVLDQNDYFLKTHCDQSFEFDIINKTRQPSGIIPLSPITKTLWTCTVEAIAEYCRIIWDIFPNGERLIKFVAFDTDSAHFMNSWDSDEQNLSSAMESFAKSTSMAHLKISKNVTHKSGDKTSIINGLSKAIEALSECSEIQMEKRKSLSDSSSSSSSSSSSTMLNRGRIICITSFRNDSHIRSIEECFIKALYDHNKLIASQSDLTSKMMPINFCECVFINTFPYDEQNQSSKIIEIPRHEISPLVSSEVHSVKSGRVLAAKLGFLALQHYDLASTTVTGIPMKEEQNASSSANYDVEIVHPASAHYELFKSGAIHTEGVCVHTMRESFPYDTVTLKWCTPRTNAVELHYCTTAHRITSVDVNSRPSSCLTNFLLSGRAVMLEMPRAKGTKMMSHMLASHNGELYIHTLGTGRSILEDPPSISEGSGGRVTDYRINDFGELMKKNHLVPCKYLQSGIKEIAFPIEKAKHSLIRQTLYWPLVIGHTILLNMHAHIQQFLQIIPKENLTADDVLECKKAIYYLLGLENKGTNLPIPTIGTRGKGPKREELYRMMWNEFEHFLRSYSVSPEHTAILNCLLECRSKPEQSSTNSNRSSATNSEDESNSKKQLNGSNKSNESEWAWKELTDWAQNEMESMSDRDKNVHSDDPPPKKLKTNNNESKISSKNSFGPQSLLQFWTTKLNDDDTRKRAEFIGRTSSNGNIAKLYTHLNEKSE